MRLFGLFAVSILCVPFSIKASSYMRTNPSGYDTIWTFQNPSGGVGVWGYSSPSTGNGVGVVGTSINNDGIEGYGSFAHGYGVAGSGETGVGGIGGPTGVYATGTTYGVNAVSTDGYGVNASSTSNYGINATSTNNYAINATSTNSSGINITAPYDGIDISSTSSGYGIFSQANTESGTGVSGSGNTGVSALSQPLYSYDNAYAFSGQAYGEPGGSTYGINVQAAYGDYVYGIYSYGVDANIQAWAGYFDGDTYTGGCFCGPSDIMFKTNVQPLQGGLEKVMALSPKSYEMKVSEFKDRVNLPKGDKFGLIAQDVEKVIPEIVHPVAAPAHLTKDEWKKHVKKAPFNFKSVDYVALVPILVEAIQEQQAEINALKSGH
jgi:hypothetical protein